MFDNAAAFTGTGTQRHCRPEKGKGRLMDRISYAKQLLCSYLINRSTVDNFRYEMQLINGKLYSCGGNDCEDRIIGLIDAKDRSESRRRQNRARTQFAFRLSQAAAYGFLCGSFAQLCGFARVALAYRAFLGLPRQKRGAPQVRGHRLPSRPRTFRSRTYLTCAQQSCYNKRLRN